MTGTVGKYSYSSAGSATDVENFEPLGQKIHPHDPVDYTAPTGGVFSGSADYPEWQCEVAKALYGSFQEWPDHCQKKILEDLSIGLADLYEYSQKQENPERVLVDSPLPTDIGPQSPSDKTPVFARTSTAKPSTRKSGAFRIGQPTIDRGHIATVQSQPSMLDEVFDHYDASVSGDDEIIYANLRARRITDREASILRKNMTDNLSGDCLGFIYQLLDQVAINSGGTIASKDLRDVFDQTLSSRGVTSGRDQSGVWLYQERSPGATAQSDWSKGDLSIALPASNYKESYLSSPEGLHHAVHELIHNSLKPMGASDRQLAVAALQLAGQTLDLSGASDQELAASNVWDDRLSRACGWQGRVGLEQYIK